MSLVPFKRRSLVPRPFRDFHHFLAQAFQITHPFRQLLPQGFQITRPTAAPSRQGSQRDAVPLTSGGTSLRRERQRSAERLASAGLVGVAVTFGLGDIAQVSPLDSLILNAVHGLLLLVIGLALASAAWQRR